MLKTMDLTLIRDGHQVIAAGNGPDAIRLVKENAVLLQNGL
jgi:hypothetical protein